MNPLIQSLLQFDGKHVAPLKHALSDATPDDFLQLVDYFSHTDAAMQTGSTWLVKSALERGIGIPRAPVEAMYDCAKSYTHWEPKLHALQAVRYLDFSHIDREKVVAALPILADDKKILVQVWALDADVRLNVENESQLNRLRQKLNLALEEGPASLKARARHLKSEFKVLE